MNAVYARFFTAPYPARTTVAVAALPLGAVVEIDLVAQRIAQPLTGLKPGSEKRMHVSRETPERTKQRLRRVAKETVVDLRDGEWWYEEFPGRPVPGPGALRRDRARAGRERLVPARAGAGC